VRQGGRPVRDLEDAADGADTPQPFLDTPEARAERAYAHRIGRTRRTPQGDVFTFSDLGAPPDTFLDDHREDADL
jgi:hypothetical protein